MLQIKTGQESPVRIVLGSNCRPPNNSHFRNLKCLKIDQVVSQKKNKQKTHTHTHTKKQGERERRKEGRKAPCPCLVWLNS